MQEFLQRRTLDMFSILNSSAAYDLNHGTDHRQKDRRNASQGKDVDFSELLNAHMKEIAVRI